MRVGLITTRGFRDVYEIGRQWRGDEVFNMFAPAPKMLLTRDRHPRGARAARFPRRGGRRRWTRDDVERAARDAGRATASRRSRSAFLFAYANPRHEQEAAEIIRGIAPDLYVSLSSEVNPEWREYERTASTVANAYIGPPVVALSARAGAALRCALPARPRPDDEVGRRRRQRRACCRARRSRP